MMLYIIDGYNLMHALDPGEITAGNLAGKRESLVEDIVNFVAGSGDEAVVVFDSSSSESVTREAVRGTSVSVVFASRSESADIIIGKLVHQELEKQGKHKGGRIRVVSADWEVQKGAMQERVERVPPRHFITYLKNFEKKVAKSVEMDKMRWKIEHKVDLETLKKLEKMRRGQDGDS